jgi:hypothetical protein
MDDTSPEVIATVAAERFGDAYGGVINAAMRQDLCHRIENAIRVALRDQGAAFSKLCRTRETLWQTTEARPTTSDPLRAEARARANEAAYLADAIAAAMARAEEQH